MNIHRFIRPALLATAAFAAASAAQADPTATMGAGYSFEEYTGSATLGNNNVNINRTLFWIYEGSYTYGDQQVDSWFVFFDPLVGRVAGTVDFGREIVYVADDQAELIATSGFQNPGFSYDHSHVLTGLEPLNKLNTSVSGSTMTLAWNAGNPGDHIRVLTIVPEPESYALMLAGLGAVGFLARRRRAV